MKQILFAVFLLSCLPTVKGAALADRLDLADGRQFEGSLLGIRSGYVTIEVRRQGDRAELRFPRSAVERIAFSDAADRDKAIALLEEGQSDLALATLEPMARKRAPLVGLLQKADEAVLPAAIAGLYSEGKLREALARSKEWRPRLAWQEHADRILEIQMLASWRLERPPDAAYFARQWIDLGRPSSPSAAAWRLLAHSALAKGQTERAFWIALQPIVFAASASTSQLDHCYAIALEACRLLDRPRRGRALLEEMRQRRIEWPAEGSFRKARTWAASIDEADPPQRSEPRFARESNRPFSTPNRLLGNP